MGHEVNRYRVSETVEMGGQAPAMTGDYVIEAKSLAWALVLVSRRLEPTATAVEIHSANPQLAH